MPDQYDVSHLAGGPGGAGYLDGTGLQARFNGPTGLWGVAGNLYVADSGERTIRKIVAATGEVSTIARLNTSLECTGPVSVESFGPSPPIISRNLSLWADSVNAYIADECLHVVYKMALSSGEPTLLSGQLQQFGSQDGAAADARFTFPRIMWGDDAYLYIQDPPDMPVLRSNQNIIRRVDKQTGGVTRVFSNITPGSFIPGSLNGDGTYLYWLTGNPMLIHMLRIDTGDVKTVSTDAVGHGQIVWRRTEGSEDFLYLVAYDRIVERIRVSTGETATFAGGICLQCTYVGPDVRWKDGPGATASFFDISAAWGDYDYLYIVERKNNTVRKIRFSTAEVTTVAGEPALPGSDDGPGVMARFSSPQSVWGDGNYLYVADYSAIRRLRISDGEVSTLAGSTSDPRPLTDGIGPWARFVGVGGIWGDSENLYVVDGRVIRKVVIATAEVTTIAGGTGDPATVDGPRDQARFKSLGGLCGDDLFLYLTDDSTIRKMNIATGEVTTIAGVPGAPGNVDGVGSAARFSKPSGIWGDGTSLYVTDASAGTIRKIAMDTGLVTTLAGSPSQTPVQYENIDGIGAAARFQSPRGIWGDGTFLYVTDDGMHNVRRIRIANGETTTVAGTAGKAGADDARGVAARFSQPTGIWGDGIDLYVGDLSNYTIRRLTAPRTGSEPALTSITPPRTASGTTTTFTITGTNFVPGETSIVVNGPGARVAGVNVESSTSLNVVVDIAAGAGIGARVVRAVQSTGTSNPIAFEVGTPPDLTRTSFAIPGRGALSTMAAQQPGLSITGYARIRPESGNQPPAGLAIYGYRKDGVLISEAAVPATPPIQAGRISLDSARGAHTGIAVLNSNDVPVILSHAVMRPDGSQLERIVRILAPGQQVANYIEYPHWPGVDPWTHGGTFSFTASSPVAVIGLRGFENERSEVLLSTLPVTDLAARRDQPVVFPHVADGGGLSSRIILTNPTDQTLTGRLQFISQSGQAWSVVLDGQAGTAFDYSIPAQGSKTFVTANASADVHIGWIRVVPATGAAYPAGVLIFSFRPAGVVITEAAVAATAPSSAFRLYVEKDNIIRTGFAIANPGTAVAQVTYELTDLNGAPVGNALTITRPIGSNSQVSMFIDQLPGFENLPVPFRGVLRISTTGAGISVSGLRGRYNERGEFLMSTAQPVDENAPSTSSDLFFPNFPQSGGFTTQFVLFPRSNLPTSGQLEFFLQTGQRMNLPLN